MILLACRRPISAVHHHPSLHCARPLTISPISHPLTYHPRIHTVPSLALTSLVDCYSCHLRSTRCRCCQHPLIRPSLTSCGDLASSLAPVRPCWDDDRHSPPVTVAHPMPLILLAVLQPRHTLSMAAVREEDVRARLLSLSLPTASHAVDTRPPALRFTSPPAVRPAHSLLSCGRVAVRCECTAAAESTESCDDSVLPVASYFTLDRNTPQMHCRTIRSDGEQRQQQQRQQQPQRTAAPTGQLCESAVNVRGLTHTDCLSVSCPTTLAPTTDALFTERQCVTVTWQRRTT